MILSEKNQSTYSSHSALCSAQQASNFGSSGDNVIFATADIVTRLSSFFNDEIKRLLMIKYINFSKVFVAMSIFNSCCLYSTGKKLHLNAKPSQLPQNPYFSPLFQRNCFKLHTNSIIILGLCVTLSFFKVLLFHHIAFQPYFVYDVIVNGF